MFDNQKKKKKNFCKNLCFIYLQPKNCTKSWPYTSKHLRKKPDTTISSHEDEVYPKKISCKHMNQSNTLFGLSLLFSMLLNQNYLLSLTHAAQQEAFRALVLCVVRQLDLLSAAESLRTEGTTSHEHKRNKLCFCKSRSGSPHERQRRAER